MSLSPTTTRDTRSSRTRRREGPAVTPYDFRRPIQLSREHARMLQVSFTGFARQATTVFTSALRSVCSVQLVSIEQRSYSEYVESLGAQAYLAKFTAEPISGLGLLEMPIEAAMSCVDHMLGGYGSAHQPLRRPTDIEARVIAGLVERLFAEMRYSLDGIVTAEPVILGVEFSPQFAQIAAAADVMVVVTMDLRIDDRVQQLTVCLPFNGLLPHLLEAAQPTPVSERERAAKVTEAAKLRDGFEEVPIDVAVRFRPTRLAPEDLTELAAGDVVRLGHPTSVPLDINVADTTFAHATAGSRGPRMAALVVGLPQKENS